MQTVQDETFYHIQRGPVSWEVGSEHFISRSVNLFVGYFDTAYKRIKDPKSGVGFPVNLVLEHAHKVFLGKASKDPQLEPFYHYDAVKCLGEANGCLAHYLKLVREFVFEEVRTNSFPTLPSRYRCIWLIPKKIESVKYWWERLGGENKRILEVQVTGKLHRASERYLDPNTFSLNQWKELAFKYWAGAREVEEVEDEILFEGFVKVLNAITPEKMGL